MMVNIVIQHKIKHGRESETMQLIKELNRQSQNSSEEKHPADFYRHHLQDFGQLNPLSNTPPRVRVYMTS